MMMELVKQQKRCLLLYIPATNDNSDLGGYHLYHSNIEILSKWAGNQGPT